MDCPNIGNYCSVEGDNFAAKKLVYRRGYGNILTSVITKNNVKSEISDFNRLQPLTAPFGTHLPPTSDPVFVLKNPETVIGWDRKQKPPVASYQNHQLGKIVTQDSTLPNPKVEDY